MQGIKKRFFSTLRPYLSKSKENYILKKYNFKCDGPNKFAKLSNSKQLQKNI